MARIYSESVNAADGYEERCIGMCNSILDFLYDECQFFTYESGQFVNNPKANPTLKKKKRMRDLINFLYSNYQNPLSLKNLTEKYDLSKYYISHAVKTATGLSFQELLGYIRSEKSLLPLINSNAKISAIAKEVGFTTTEYYKKHFKFWYGKTPDEYRKEYLLRRRRAGGHGRLQRPAVFTDDRIIAVRQSFDKLGAVCKEIGRAHV